MVPARPLTMRRSAPAPPTPPAIFLMGPTASGKTALAAALSEALPVELISVDAAQVYRGMDIGTAKPDAQTRARVPHRLIDIRHPLESYSAAEFRADALREMAAVSDAGRIPMLVGGTMFYFHVLEHGLPALPPPDPRLRRRIAAQARREGWAALHAQLRGIDARAAEGIDPADGQRIQRALEIVRLSGAARPAASGAPHGPTMPYTPIRLAVTPSDRSLLHRRIATRFEAMLRAGLVDEVRRLMAAGDFAPAAPSGRMVGYRQVAQYLAGQIGYTALMERSVAATRQLAKRQLTWLRRKRGVVWLDAGSRELEAAAVVYLTNKLTTLRL